MQERIAVDTLGTLHAYGYGMSAYCLACGSQYRKDVLPSQNSPSSFDIDTAGPP